MKKLDNIRKDHYRRIEQLQQSQVSRFFPTHLEVSVTANNNVVAPDIAAVPTLSLPMIDALRVAVL